MSSLEIVFVYETARTTNVVFDEQIVEENESIGLHVRFLLERLYERR